ncbi:MAG: hypothetical protein HN931_00785 [Desulfobacterales bacterium]|nr:hypothetical protein [Desulfobacteraceae bacterium]MBT4365261.1 hypothetical protein [Desulfobacteraceae bacterium]MBT7084691.1 hypothetical protein [Desulfobacterales bacterium]
MKPVYFPHTFISEQMVSTVCNFFQQIVVYQPSEINIPENIQKMADNGILEIKIPIDKDGEKLDSISRDFRDWRSLVTGVESSYLKTQKGRVPFFEDSAISRIRSNIKDKSENTTKENPDTDLNARLFLLLSQQYDMQKHEIDQNLLLTQNMEQEIFNKLIDDRADLTGSGLEDPAIDLKPKVSPDDNMISERISSWTRLFMHDRDISGLYITHSKAIFEYLIEKTNDSEILSGSDSIHLPILQPHEMKKWQETLINKITALADGSLTGIKDNIPRQNDNNRNMTSLSLCRVAGKTPYEFFGGFLENNASVKVVTNTIYKNCIFGLIK